MKKTTLFLSLLFAMLTAVAQNKVTLQFNLSYNNQALQPGLTCYNPATHDSISFETFKFYISNIQFWQNGKAIAGFAKQHPLIDAEDSASQTVTLNVKKSIAFNQLTFDVGIDSTTNASGAMGGDLDPTNGMYWTWQSGYINFKLEGTGLVPFKFHIGGYKYPYNTLSHISLATPNSQQIRINVAIDELLRQLDLKTTTEVMSPNQKALDIAHLYPTLFKIAP
jgi:hypothetical protein